MNSFQFGITQRFSSGLLIHFVWENLKFRMLGLRLGLYVGLGLGFYVGLGLGLGFYVGLGLELGLGLGL